LPQRGPKEKEENSSDEEAMEKEKVEETKKADEEDAAECQVSELEERSMQRQETVQEALPGQGMPDSHSSPGSRLRSPQEKVGVTGVEEAREEGAGMGAQRQRERSQVKPGLQAWTPCSHSSEPSRRPLPQRAWGVMGVEERNEETEEMGVEEEERMIESILQRWLQPS